MTPDLPVRVTANTGPFRRDLRGAEQYAQTFGNRMNQNMRMAQNWALALSAAGLAAGSIARKTLDYADSIDKAARAANVGAERLQTLRFAGEQSGISIEKMDSALAKFNVTFGRVMSGMETQSSSVTQAFEKLGLSQEEMQRNGLGTEQMLDVVIARLGDVSDGAEQAAIAAQLFGRSAGPEMRNLLANGVEGLRNLEDAARDAGNVIENELITRGVEIADKWHQIMSSMTRSTAQFSLQAARAIDNALGFTDSGKIAGIQLDMKNAVDEYADLEERFIKGQQMAEERGRSMESSPQLMRMKESLENLSGEINRYNSQLMEFSEVAAERDRKLNAIASFNPGIEQGDLPSSGDSGSSSGGGVGGGGTSTVPKSNLGPTDEDLETMAERWESKLELLDENLAKERETLALAREQGLLDEEEYQAKLTDLEKRYSEKRGEIAQLEAAAKLQTVLASGQEVLGAMGAFNERALKISQAFGAAQALVSTWEGSARALATEPFPANLKAAASITAKGLALVGAIRGVTAGSSGGGGGGGRGAGAAGAAGSSAQDVVERRVAEFRFVGGSPAVFDPRAIVDAMNEAAKDGVLLRGSIVS